MGSFSHFQFAEHLIDATTSIDFPPSSVNNIRMEIATTIITQSGKHFKSFNQCPFLIGVGTQVRISTCVISVLVASATAPPSGLNRDNGVT